MGGFREWALDPLNIIATLYSYIGYIASEISLTTDFPESVLSIAILCCRKHQIQS